MKQPEYHEGPDALERFKVGMTKLFQAKKETAKDEPKPKRKQSKSSKG